MRRTFIYAYIITALLIPRLCFGAKILGVRHWTAPEHTRIVLDVDIHPAYTAFSEGKPACLIVMLKNTTASKSLNTLKIDDSLVKGVRFKRKDKKYLGVIIDLKTPAKSRVFVLKKYQDKPNRLVIDVLNTQAEQLIKQETKAVDAVKQKGHYIVVIDPGHGGEDPGAIGRRLKLKEKDVVLSIARKLYNLLKAQPGITPYLTRKGDYYVPLHRRVQIAGRYKADLFISIHANANRNTSKRGSSIYYLSEKGASDKAARLLAKRENAADLIGGDVWAKDRTTNAVLFDLSQTSTRNESIIFAKGVIGGYKQVKQVSMDADLRSAPFAVLKSLRIPSILLETAFITNKTEEKLLASSKFRAKVANALKTACVKYLLGASGRQRHYVVKKGDTIWRIAHKHGIEQQQLRKWNKLGKSNTIFPGQKLRVGY